MNQKRKRVYEALVDGATEGRSSKDLYKFVLEHCPKATSKKIVRASLLALTDPHLKDRQILQTIYALAIEHRMDDISSDNEPDDDEDPKEKSPTPRKLKKRRRAEIANSAAPPQT